MASMPGMGLAMGIADITNVKLAVRIAMGDGGKGEGFAPTASDAPAVCCASTNQLFTHTLWLFDNHGNVNVGLEKNSV